MDTATETERKYDVPPDFVVPVLTGFGGVSTVAEPETHELDATYFDTDDLRLARNRRTLRRRTGGPDAGWHLKTPGDGTNRTEHRLPLDTERDPGTDSDAGNDTSRGNDTSGAEAVPARLRAEVRTIVRTRPLRPVARLRTRRRETALRDETGRTLALLAQDDVTAETGGSEQRWSELEVELVDGTAAVLDAVERRLLAAGATPAAGPSKLARALGDRLHPARPKKIKNPVVGYVRSQRDAITTADPAARAGVEEAIHAMRVATRRLRSTLKTFRALWQPDQVAPLRAELKWLGERLGAVRDAQVQARRLSDMIDPDDADLTKVSVRLRAHLGEQLDRGRTALGAALDDSRYLRLLDDLDRLCDTDPAPGGDLHRPARKALRKADRLLDGARDDERLHAARKAYKQARYAAEVFVPSVGKPA
ncbi:MAG TPA: CYTH and CHAD domain-containing protein, partial [Actinoplanes sp.]|nr:CYTH and CHAD domain-containing protein [Actinoplanes sp.]